jgi:ferric-dicitrate binding protein FerR (iron transport regulator)
MIPTCLDDPNALGEAVARYLAGDCSAGEVAALSAALERDPAAAAVFVEIATQAALVRDWAQTTPPTAVEVSPPRRRILPRAIALATSLCLAFIVGLAFVVGRPWSAFDARRHLGRIESASAAVRHAHDGRTAALDVGDGFEAGTLATDLMETAVVRLRDGTLLALGTDTELELSDDGRKRVVLVRGTFTADVVPQPVGRPMMIRTPTAELEVVGTAFSLAAEPERTHLDVDKGLVRVRRLTDDAAVDVPAGREVRVSPDASAPLELGASTRSSDAWRVDFAAGPPPGWTAGEWIPEHGSLRAVLTQEGSRSRGVVSNSAWRDGDHSLARLHDDSVVRVTLRCRTSADIAVVLSLRESDTGPFVCNVFARGRCVASKSPRDDWRTLELPLSDFSPYRTSRPIRIPGASAFMMSVATKQDLAGLEVKAIEIARRSPPAAAASPSAAGGHPSP